MIRAGVSGSARSAGSSSTSVPCAESGLASHRSRPARRAVNTRECPRAASSLARAAPRPDEAPVTSTIFEPHRGMAGFPCTSIAAVTLGDLAPQAADLVLGDGAEL